MVFFLLHQKKMSHNPRHLVYLAIPMFAITITVGCFRITSLRWRAKLQDPEGDAHQASKQSSEILATYTSRVKDQMSLRSECNPGVCMVPLLEQEETVVLLNEVERLMKSVGSSQNSFHLAAWKEQLGVDYSSQKFFSDHVEGRILPRAPWGCGDAIRMEEIPLSFRALNHRVRSMFPYIGQLRHIYVEYSPAGHIFHPPASTKHFDGHDYVVVPLFDEKENVVVTFSPELRSRSSSLQEVAMESWGAMDFDTLLSRGSCLRVFGEARYGYSWCSRPHAWYGSPHHSMYPVDTLVARSNDAARKKEEVDLNPSWWSQLFRSQGTKQQQVIPSSVVMVMEKEEEKKRVAFVILHYEGPYSRERVRNRWMLWEYLAFGNAPQVFTTWEDDRPLEEDIRSQYIVGWLWKDPLGIITKLT